MATFSPSNNGKGTLHFQSAVLGHIKRGQVGAHSQTGAACFYSSCLLRVLTAKYVCLYVSIQPHDGWPNISLCQVLKECPQTRNKGSNQERPLALNNEQWTHKEANTKRLCACVCVCVCCVCGVALSSWLISNTYPEQP